MTEKQAAVSIFALSGAAVVVVSIVWKAQIAVSPWHARQIGLVLVGLGILVAGLAWLAARAVFQGGVDPVSETLATGGPYRIVRHPVYLGFTVAFVGVALTTRSYAGLVALAVGFIPAAIYRARLEERALSERFGDQWREYAGRTAFMLPGIW